MVFNIIFLSLSLIFAKEINIIDPPKDIKIPVTIWDHLTLDKKPNLIYNPVTVVLNEKNKGVLSDEEIKILLPSGGGEIDLSSYLTGKNGTFFVRFEFPYDINPDFFHVFFVSQNRKRKLDGELIGSGCKEYFDIKKYFLKTNSKGIEVNTTRSRHLSVLGGHVVFFQQDAKNINLTQVTFTDSTKPEFFCERKKDEPAESL
jgi:hypothetical protein